MTKKNLIQVNIERDTYSKLVKYADKNGLKYSYILSCVVDLGLSIIEEQEKRNKEEQKGCGCDHLRHCA